MPPRPKPPSWIPQDMRAKEDRDTPKPVILLLSAILFVLVALLIAAVVLAVNGKDKSAETTYPSPEPTNTATVSPSVTPKTSTYYSSATTRWGDIVDNPPAGLREKVEQNSTRLQFSWSDVRIWANAHKPDGSKGDARVIVIVGNDELTKGRQDRARREVGLEGASVHVIAADSLTTVDGERLQGTQVILAPLKMESDGIAKEFRRFQSGIAFTEKGSLSPVLIQGVQLPPRP